MTKWLILTGNLKETYWKTSHLTNKQIHIIEAKDWREIYLQSKLEKDQQVLNVWPYKEKLPEGWRRLSGTLTAPTGYYIANNGLSRWDPKYDFAIIKEEEEVCMMKS